jgi:hypothetical protein
VDEFADHGAEDESGDASKIEGSPVSEVEKVKKSVHLYTFTTPGKWCYSVLAA